jgi:hypothetical protein
MDNVQNCDSYSVLMYHRQEPTDLTENRSLNSASVQAVPSQETMR